MGRTVVVSTCCIVGFMRNVICENLSQTIGPTQANCKSEIKAIQVPTAVIYRVLWQCTPTQSNVCVGIIYLSWHLHCIQKIYLLQSFCYLSLSELSSVSKAVGLVDCRQKESEVDNFMSSLFPTPSNQLLNESTM